MNGIWPGWTAVLSNAIVGLVTLPIMVTGQVICMRMIAKLRKHVASVTAMNRALVEENEALQKRLVRNTQLAKRERRERPGAFGRRW